MTLINFLTIKIIRYIFLLFTNCVSCAIFIIIAVQIAYAKFYEKHHVARVFYVTGIIAAIIVIITSAVLIKDSLQLIHIFRILAKDTEVEAASFILIETLIKAAERSQIISLDGAIITAQAANTLVSKKYI